MMKPGDKLVERVFITRCQLRDRQALAELIERYERPVRYFLRRLVDNADLADELFQDTWLTVIRKIHMLGNPERFTVWLYRIARNRVYQEFRRKKQTVELDESMAAFTYQYLSAVFIGLMWCLATEGECPGGHHQARTGAIGG